MTLGSGKRAQASITTSSMADIAFLLIVFFLVTSVFAANKGLDFVGAGESEGRAEPAVFVEVLPDGALRIDGRTASASELLPYLAPKLARWPSKPVLLHTHADAPYAAMIRVYDELALVTRPESEGGLGLPHDLNLQVPTHRELREYETIFGRALFDGVDAD